MKILAVDDNPQNLYLLEVLLRGHGYEVISAHNGVEALEKASQDQFDLIISDILMPQMDGFQLCRAVKANRQLQDVAFVFYSAQYIDRQDQEFALSLGADQFVVKPQDPRVLLAIVQDVLRQRSACKPVALPPPEVDEAVYMKEYNERLIHKLEENMLELEETYRRLTESETQYRALVEQSLVGVYLLGRDRIAYINRAGAAIFGYEPEEMIGHVQVSDLVHPEDRPLVLQNIALCLRGDVEALQ
jgi:CheY-like chemotaxis protein